MQYSISIMQQSSKTYLIKVHQRKYLLSSILLFQSSVGGTKGWGVLAPPPYFGRSVNPIPTRVQVILTTFLLASHGFSNLPLVLQRVSKSTKLECLSNFLNSYASKIQNCTIETSSSFYILSIHFFFWLYTTYYWIIGYYLKDGNGKKCNMQAW